MIENEFEKEKNHEIIVTKPGLSWNDFKRWNSEPQTIALGLWLIGKSGTRYPHACLPCGPFSLTLGQNAGDATGWMSRFHLAHNHRLPPPPPSTQLTISICHHFLGEKNWPFGLYHAKLKRENLSILILSANFASNHTFKP